MVQKAWLWIKKEFYNVFPAFVFFLISFSIINFFEGLFLKKEGIPAFPFTEVFFAAAIVAKVLIVIDHLPFVSLFPHRPLICNILWKTFLYEMGALLIRFAIRIAPFIHISKSFSVDYQSFLLQFDLNRFLAVQILYLCLFFVFVVSKELTYAIGRKEMVKLLFGPKAPRKN